MSILRTGSIDKKREDVERYLLLADSIQKYPCSYNKGRWISISKVLKSTPKACKRRWRTLRRHYNCGLLTNKQLLDKLQFLKNIVNIVPASQFLRNSMPSQHTLSAIKENHNLVVVPIVESVDTNTKSLSLGCEVYETSKKRKDTPEIRITVAHDSNVKIVRIESCSQKAAELVNSINFDERNSLEVNEITKSNRQTNNFLSVENEGYDSDLEIIEPYIETIEVD